jgi:hypothetical protein
MSTSKKSESTIRQGGPGSSDQNAREPKDLRKPEADPSDRRARSESSSGGGERDRRHSHDPDHRS